MDAHDTYSAAELELIAKWNSGYKGNGGVRSRK
jgi:hypothetical protein